LIFILTNRLTIKMTRFQQLQTWVAQQYNFCPELYSLNNDASFRKYYRFKYNQNTFVAVDSLPQRENNAAFIGVQEILFNKQVNVPSILHYNQTDGFFILEDLGDDILLPKLTTTKQPEFFYQLALEELLKIQSCDADYVKQYTYKLPVYDVNLLTYEMELFREWFLQKYLQIELTQNEQRLLDNVFSKMILNAYEQPQVLVHRDFHSRNLIYTNNKVAVIDFQDALWGPLTYDLVSLYRDCYIAWPMATVEAWVLRYLEQAKIKGVIPQNIDFKQYWHWFLQMTLQRNFKTIGIFCRLFLRDNKPAYIDDIPRTLGYALATSKLLATEQEHDSSNLFADLHQLLNTKILVELNRFSNDVRI
jgi:aminoglycoside/choline kinase family phosphotransferase